MNAAKHAERSTAADFVGISAWAQKIRADIRRVAPYNTTILIAGPTGTGKELVAEAIHAHSPRAEKPCIPVNCAAVSPQLFASHMFGHEKGAFTGAHFAAAGCFRTADGGTVFLDEVGELELEMQALLLRVLQDQRVVPVGANQSVPVDVRLIAATNRRLDREVEQGRFREDLLYRLNVVPFRMAALKRRREDILPLAEHCLGRLTDEHGLPAVRLASDAMDWMVQYDWPGNVRQLQNVLERAVIFADSDRIDHCLLEQAASALSDFSWEQSASIDFPADAQDTSPADRLSAELPKVGWPKLAELERDHICLTLERTYYNQTAAAELLGVTFRTLSRKIKRYGIDTSRSRRGRPRKGRGRLSS